ncbi:MAG: hypothetical protein IJW92_09070, partial [Clostridia bacterium]|nr:hypothetical protein [Clostridia bacterium]
EEAEATETVEEPTEEEIAEEDNICAVVADSVAEAFDMVVAEGIAPKAVEGTTLDSITEAVNNAADANVPETWTESVTDEVKIAVVEELAARLLGNNDPEEEPLDEEPELVEEIAEEVVEEAVEEPAEETVAETAEALTEESDSDEDEDGDDNDEDEGSNFGGFGSMPLTYIDAMANPEQYNDMLEQERRGEVRLVTRYRRSFQSRLAQSQGNVQDYYNVLKNTLLSYKGIKNRISWNYESFNLGRTHVAKFNAKTRTLYLYMALNAEELADTKYGIVDVSSKKKYATVPVLMKIKGERKFKHALELIVKLCEENLQLPKKKVFEEEDYRVPFKTTEELVNEGLVRMMVAAIPMEYFAAETATEETPAETPAQSTEETPAVEETPKADAPAEEVPATEEAVEATAAEDVAANAEASEDENKNI